MVLECGGMTRKKTMLRRHLTVIRVRYLAYRDLPIYSPLDVCSISPLKLKCRKESGMRCNF